MALLGYTRISTVHQDDQLQRDALLKAGVLSEHIYSDVVSGSRDVRTRPGMMKLLQFVRAEDTIVVWRIDRLGRSLLDVIATVADFRARGIQVQSISDGIDPSTTSGRLLLHMLSTLAEYERELIIERVNAGIAAARTSGAIFGRPLSDPELIKQKLTVVQAARAGGKSAVAAAQLVGWSRATFYRHQAKHSPSQ
jgi:DNA invertase Pin-like site-specific DNA recombinase